MHSSSVLTIFATLFLTSSSVFAQSYTCTNGLKVCGAGASISCSSYCVACLGDVCGYFRRKQWPIFILVLFIHCPSRRLMHRSLSCSFLSRVKPTDSFTNANKPETVPLSNSCTDATPCVDLSNPDFTSPPTDDQLAAAGGSNGDGGSSGIISIGGDGSGAVPTLPRPAISRPARPTRPTRPTRPANPIPPTQVSCPAVFVRLGWC